MSLVVILLMVFVIGAGGSSAAQSLDATLVHPNSRAACPTTGEIPSRFADAAIPAPMPGLSTANRIGTRMIRQGSQILLEGASILALISAPIDEKGGGAIEGVTHRRTGGDLLIPSRDDAHAGAWEICLGGPRTHPDSCSPDGLWVDSRKLQSSWRSIDTGGTLAVRFSWSDASLGLSVTQDLVAAEEGLKARISARSNGTRYGIVAVRFPIVHMDYGGARGSDGELVVPRGNLGIKCRDCYGDRAYYPTIYQTMPWFGMLKGEQGLYVGAHDPSGSMKRVAASGPKGDGTSFFEIYPEDSGALGNAVEPNWDYEIAPICARRGWPALAHHYKGWVTANTEWGRARKLVERTDIPRDLRDGAWWFVHSIADDAPIDVLEQQTEANRKDFPGIPTVHHWYSWHRPGMDRGFPDHLPKPGLRELIARLQSDPLTRIVLYTNAVHSDQSTAPRETGRPDCPTGASVYPRHWHDTLQQPDGKRIFGVPSSGACLAAMDLTSPGWQAVVQRNSDEVTNRLGAAGVYLDVIGNVVDGSWSPIRHAAGRGAWVTSSARDVVRAVFQRPALVLVEGALEQMAGISSAGTNYLPSSVDMVPLFPLVYHEQFILAGMQSLPPDDHDALRIKNGMSLAWGLQPGLNSLQWHTPERSRNIEWANKVVRARRAWANWLAYGEYLGPLDQDPAVATELAIARSWSSSDPNRPSVEFRRGAVEASLYRGVDGRYAVILVNLGVKPAVTRIRLPAPLDRARVQLRRSGRIQSAEPIRSPVDGAFDVDLEAGEIMHAELFVESGLPAVPPVR